MTTGLLTTAFNGFLRRRLQVVLVAAALITVLIISAGPLIQNDNDSAIRNIDPELVKQIGDVRQRIQVLKGLVEQTPNYTIAMKELADAYLEMGVLQKASDGNEQSRRYYQLAVDQYGRYLALSPKDEDATIYLSLAHLNLGENDKAISLMEEQYRLRPGSQKTWYSLGWVYEKSGSRNEAEWAWQKGLQIDPNSAMGQKITEFLGADDSSKGIFNTQDPSALGPSPH